MSNSYKYLDPDFTYTDPKTGLLRNLPDITDPDVLLFVDSGAVIKKGISLYWSASLVPKVLWPILFGKCWWVNTLIINENRSDNGVYKCRTNDLICKKVCFLPLLFQNVFKSLQPKIFLERNFIKFTPLPLTNLWRIFCWFIT